MSDTFLTKELISGLIGQPVTHVCAALATVQIEHGQSVKVFPMRPGILYAYDTEAFDPERIRVMYDPQTDRVTDILGG